MNLNISPMVQALGSLAVGSRKPNKQTEISTVSDNHQLPSNESLFILGYLGYPIKYGAWFLYFLVLKVSIRKRAAYFI